MSDEKETGAAFAQGSIGSYTLGLILALILTAIAFAGPVLHLLPPRIIWPVAITAAVLQIVVHLAYFLHLARASTPRWNVVVFCFAALIVGIIVGGSLWIMSNANANMMS